MPSISKTFEIIYRFILILTTIGLTFYCIHKYNLDQSVSQVDFKAFHKDKQDLYPSLSLCFEHSVLQEKITQHYEGAKKSIYKTHLSGHMLDEYLNKRYLNIGYEKVAINFTDYLDEVYILLGNGTTMIHQNSKNFTTIKDKYTPGRKISRIPVVTMKNVDSWNRCFTFEVPFIHQQNIEYFRISMNKSVFPSGFLNGFRTQISYPNQLMRSGSTAKSDWNKMYNEDDDEKDITLKLEIENMRVINQRNTQRNPCHAEWLNDDQKLFEQMFKEVGCVAPYLHLGVNKPICTRQKQLTIWRDTLTRFYQTPISKEINPCRVIRNVRYSSKIVTGTRYKEKVFSVAVRFPEYYMEIEHVREYSIESLVGNAGGYLGLFLGYALLQLPGFVSEAYLAIKHILKRFLSSVSNDDCQNLDNSPQNQIKSIKVHEEDHSNTELSLIRKQLNAIRHDVAILKSQPRENSTPGGNCQMNERF
jgi:hypothetical protein